MKNGILLGIACVCLFTLAAPAQERYAKDRVYTGNQVSNTVSVIDPATNKLLGEIVLGKPQTNMLTALYKGQALVHGLGYSRTKHMLAVVAIGSNSVTLVSTPDNRVLRTIYIGRAPHEPTFTPDGSEVWVTVRGEAYVSVIDVATMKEIRQIPVSDGPGMIAFTPDGKRAYVCSSFSPILDVVDTKTYKVTAKIEVPSSFSPNIFMSPDGKLVALTLKDIGKVVVVDTATDKILKVLPTGAITNHVTFTTLNGRLLMPVTVGGENCVKVFDVADDYKLVATVPVGALPHGEWASPDGKRLYVGLEYADQVQPVDLEAMTSLPPIQIGQSPQALLYAPDAVPAGNGTENLKPLQDEAATQVIVMQNLAAGNSTLKGQLVVRPAGLTDLVEQLFLHLRPNTAYTLALSHSAEAPYSADYVINSFTTDANGKYAGQSTGLVKSASATSPEETYNQLILIEKPSGNVVMTGVLTKLE